MYRIRMPPFWVEEQGMKAYLAQPAMLGKSIRGEMDGNRYLKEETCRIFTTTTSKSARRYLGFDKPVPANPKHSPCCASAPMEVYGHTGYTGTCCWVDPVNKFVFVFLSNRTYPNDAVNKLAKMNIRTRIQEVIYQSMKK